MYLSIAEAAQELEVSAATVRRMIQRGELIGHKKTRARNSPYVINAASVFTYRDRQKAEATETHQQ